MLTYSGFYGTGIKEIWDMVDEYRHYAMDTGYFYARRQKQAKWWMYEAINEALHRSFYNSEVIKSQVPYIEEQILSDQLSSFVAAQKLLDTYYASLKS